MDKPKKKKAPATQKQKMDYTMKHGSTLDKIGMGFKLGAGIKLKNGGTAKSKTGINKKK